jgi:hypothetical protein
MASQGKEPLMSGARVRARSRPWLEGSLAFLACVTVLVVAGEAPAVGSGKAKVEPIGHAVTLHYFEKQVRSTLTDAGGKVLKSGRKPSKGDKLDIFDRDYVGNHGRHASKPSASEHLSCVYESTASARCSDQITIGSSSIRSKPASIVVGRGNVSFAVNGGTGKYRGARGLVTSIQVAGSKNSDLSVVVLPAASPRGSGSA